MGAPPELPPKLPLINQYRWNLGRGSEITLLGLSFKPTPNPYWDTRTESEAERSKAIQIPRPIYFYFFASLRKIIIIIIKEFPFLCFFSFFFFYVTEERRGMVKKMWEGKGAEEWGVFSVGEGEVCGVDMSGVLFWVWATP